MQVHMSDWVTISSNDLTAQVNPTGAELSVLRDADGNDYLWHGDPTYWTGRSPVLFPIVGRAPDDTISLPDGTFPMQKHGFARRSKFKLLDHSDQSCRFELTQTPEIAKMWPFEFRLIMSISLNGTTLTQSATVENLSDREMPFNFGFHPAFNWPLPNGQGAHEIVRDDLDDPVMVRHRNGVLRLEPLQTPFENGRCILSPTHFDEDAMIFLGGAGKGLTFKAEAGPKLHFTFHNLPDLGVWSARNAPFLCIEPWHGADAIEGRSNAMSERPSVYTLNAGERAEFAYSVTITR